MTTPFYRRAPQIGVRRQNDPGIRSDAYKHMLKPHPPQISIRTGYERPLQIMKFGGTSVADASCIKNVVRIVQQAAKTNNVVVVVSAMRDVTDELVEAAARSDASDGKSAAKILNALRQRHCSVVDALLRAGPRRELLLQRINEMFEHCSRLCLGTVMLRELTLRVRDAIWSVGERLSAPLLAAALEESEVPSEAVEATDVVVTDNRHGGADPLMEPTRVRCEARLRPLLDRNIVPVTTGFIGATTEGVLTTLGRGGSDYSATIIGASLHADEVIIWTDVDGVLTADPRQVRGTGTIPEMSYREAAEHAHFGAKVLHPKTLRALMRCDFPVWVRNTFAPQRLGTKITPSGSAKSTGVKAITAISDVSMISVGGSSIANVPDVLGRTFATISSIRTEVLLTSHSSSQNDICLIVPSAHAERTAVSLRDEFAPDLPPEKQQQIPVDATIAIVTVIGQNMRAMSEIIGRIFSALGRKKINIIASAQGSSECNISFVVARKDVKATLITIHREFKLGKTKASSRNRKKS